MTKEKFLVCPLDALLKSGFSTPYNHPVTNRPCACIMRTPLRSLLRPVFGLVLLLATLKAAVAAPPTYSVAIVPQFSAQQIHAEWQPLLKRVGDEALIAGQSVEIVAVD